jgi:hypothetical protein
MAYRILILGGYGQFGRRLTLAEFEVAVRGLDIRFETIST